MNGRAVEVVVDTPVSIFGESLAEVLSAEGAGWVSREAGAPSPDVAVVHVEPRACGGLAAIERLAGAGAVVVAVVEVRDPLLVAQCIESGAAYVVDGARTLDDLVATVADAAKGVNAISDEDRVALLAELYCHRAEQERRSALLTQLTMHERQVLAFMMRGTSARDIGTLRSVSLKTVQTQISSVLQKLGVRSQLAAVAAARDAGFDPDGETGMSRASALRRTVTP